MGRVSAAELQDHTIGLAYPVGKNEIKKHLEKKGATEKVRGVFNLLPDKKYNSPLELSQALGEVEY